MTINIGWWIIPAIISIWLIYKAWPKHEEYTHGNYSQFEIDNFIRLFWLIPLGFVWAIYFGLSCL